MTALELFLTGYAILLCTAAWILYDLGEEGVIDW
jgi:hypothetical protein